LTDRDEGAERVIRRAHKAGKVEADPLHGLFSATIDGESHVVEYEPDSELRDTETVPF
jgi:type I restriction enzyme M protein